MTAFLAKNAGSSPSSFFRRRGQSLLLVLVMLLVFVAPVGAVNTGSLTRDAPLNTGPTNGDVGIPEDPLYGARHSRVGEIADGLQRERREGGKSEEAVAPFPSLPVPADRRLLRREAV